MSERKDHVLLVERTVAMGGEGRDGSSLGTLLSLGLGTLFTHMWSVAG